MTRDEFVKRVEARGTRLHRGVMTAVEKTEEDAGTLHVATMLDRRREIASGIMAGFQAACNERVDDALVPAAAADAVLQADGLLLALGELDAKTTESALDVTPTTAEVDEAAAWLVKHTVYMHARIEGTGADRLVAFRLAEWKKGIASK